MPRYRVCLMRTQEITVTAIADSAQEAERIAQIEAETWQWPRGQVRVQSTRNLNAEETHDSRTADPVPSSTG